MSEAMYYKQTFLFLMMELFRYRYRQDLQHLGPWELDKISFPLWTYSEKNKEHLQKLKGEYGEMLWPAKMPKL